MTQVLKKIISYHVISFPRSQFKNTDTEAIKPKIPNGLGKMSENVIVRFARWWTFCTGGVNWHLMRHNFHKVADKRIKICTQA